MIASLKPYPAYRKAMMKKTMEEQRKQKARATVRKDAGRFYGSLHLCAISF